MKLMQSGPEKNKAGELVTKVIKESDNLEELQDYGISISNKMNNPDARWITGPVGGSGRISDARNYQLEISESCYLKINGN